MTKTFLKTLAPMMLGLAAAAPFAIAHAGDFGGMPHGKMMLDHMLDTVDATDAQRTQIEAIHAKYAPQMKDLHQQIKQTHESEMALDTTSSGYLDQASSLIDQRTALMAKAEKLHAQLRQEVAAVLTSDQRAKLKTEMTSFHKHRHHEMPAE
ncbi:MAG TPA: Spy/CpxP family protein refolding chaperone [Nevskiaceae bacterium]|nr:Spy/CpxP family protein refolding chaperone [Nevskiaceae bacterium]